jgi:hypothetical protein
MNLILLSLFLIYTNQYTCFSKDSLSPTVCNSQGSCVAQDICSCYSGYSGQQCSNVASSNTCTWNVNSQLQTNYYPLLQTSTLNYQNDNLIFNLIAPIVTGRLNTTVYIEDPKYTSCTYPGPYSTNTLSTTSPCSNIFGFVLPWIKGKNCGWTQVVYPDYILYKANIFINEIENIGYIRNTPIQRTITRVIPMSVKFATSVVISTNIKVFSPVNQFVAVTKQVYNARSTSIICK